MKLSNDVLDSIASDIARYRLTPGQIVRYLKSNHDVKITRQAVWKRLNDRVIAEAQLLDDSQLLLL